MRKKEKIIAKKTPKQILEDNEKALKAFRSLWDFSGKKKVVNFSELQKIPFLEKYPMAKGIYAYRMPTDEDIVTLYITAQKGSRVKFHEHDCFQEMWVLKGNLLEFNDYILIKPGTIHKDTALEDSTVIVMFYK